MSTSPNPSQAVSSTAPKSCCTGWLPTGASLAFISLRLWLALRALVTGIDKFSGTKLVQKPLLDEFGNPDISGAMVEVKTKAYGLAYYHGIPPSLETALRAEPLMPGWALTAYGYALGPLLILTGLMLLVGAGTRLSLFVMGVIYSTLTVGLILLNQDAGIAWLAIHVIMVGLALKWSDFNRWALCCGCCKKS